MGRASRVLARVGVVSLTAIVVCGCEIQRAQEASDAQTTMVGLSKEQVLACMGSPAGMAAVGSTEVWTYNSGNDRTDTEGWASAWGGWSSAFGVGGSTKTSRSCKISVVMTAARVSRVNYAGPTGGWLTHGEQCAFAVENCLHQLPAYLPASPAAMSANQVTAMPLSAPAPLAAPLESAPPAQRAACTKEDVALARWAQEHGYQYHSNCN